MMELNNLCSNELCIALYMGKMYVWVTDYKYVSFKRPKTTKLHFMYVPEVKPGII